MQSFIEIVDFLYNFVDKTTILLLQRNWSIVFFQCFDPIKKLILSCSITEQHFVRLFENFHCYFPILTSFDSVHSLLDGESWLEIFLCRNIWFGSWWVESRISVSIQLLSCSSLQLSGSFRIFVLHLLSIFWFLLSTILSIVYYLIV